MPVQTRSHSRNLSSNSATLVSSINNAIKLHCNAKGHPTVGHLTVHKTLKRQPRVNPYLDKCNTLEVTVQTLSDIFEMKYYLNIRSKRNTDLFDHWIKEVYTKLYDFVHLNMEPTLEEIDAMLLVYRLLIDNNMKNNIEEFILNCPRKFLQYLCK